MRDYGKVHTSFWTSSNIRELSEDGRTLALYLLTCPHGTIAGVFRLPDGYACEDLQWEADRVRVTLSELFRKGFATRCEATKWVWVTKHFEWNPPENPNQKKAAAKMAMQVPDLCSWKADFIGKCGIYLGIEPAKPEPLLNPLATVPESVSVSVSVAGAGGVSANPSDPSGSPPPTDPENQAAITSTMAAAVCVALKSIGMGQVSPGNQNLKNLIDEGADIGTFVEIGRECVENKKPFAYLLAKVRGRMSDAALAASAATAKLPTSGGMLPGAI